MIEREYIPVRPRNDFDVIVGGVNMIKRGTLERLDGKYAVLLWENGSSFIPRRYLPPEARLGDTIIFDGTTYTLDVSNSSPSSFQTFSFRQMG